MKDIAMGMMLLISMLIFASIALTKEKVKRFIPANNSGYNQKCGGLQQSGWIKDQSTWNMCVSHVNSPLYKKGAILKLKNSDYDSSCKFRIRRPTISPQLKKKAYDGEVLCPDLNNKFEVMYEDAFELEENLE